MASEIITARALTTVARIKGRLTITVPDHDTTFERMIMGVTELLESLCNKKFGTTTYTNEVYSIHNPGMDILALKNAPVTTLTSLEYRAGTPSTPSWTAYTADQYELMGDGKSGLVKVYGGVPRGTNTIRATYVAGYKIDFANVTSSSLHTLPFDLTDLAERLVTKRFKKRDSEGKSSETLSGETVNYEEFITAEDQAIINRYGRIAGFV